MMDNIYEEVQKDNVIKVMTHNATNYKAVQPNVDGMRKMLFWTPCVAHCVDLMLEDYDISIYEERIPKGKTITTFISIQELL